MNIECFNCKKRTTTIVLLRKQEKSVGYKNPRYKNSKHLKKKKSGRIEWREITLNPKLIFFMIKKKILKNKRIINNNKKYINSNNENKHTTTSCSKRNKKKWYHHKIEAILGKKKKKRIQRSRLATRSKQKYWIWMSYVKNLVSTRLWVWLLQW